jgi:dipeptidyl aminopeptidase/acylaminoacyl peptidase
VPVASALERAARDGHFDVDAASPAAAAKRIQSSVFLVHGADDHETTPDHSQRIFTALTGPKRLVIVPGATHNTSLHGNIWLEIEPWINDILPLAGL